MQKQLIIGAFLSVALVGLSGCPTEPEFVVRPGLWEIEWYDDDGSRMFGFSVRLDEDYSAGLVDFEEVPLYLGIPITLFPVEWWQFGESFVLEDRVQNGSDTGLLWHTAKVRSETDLAGDVINPDTGTYLYTFSAEWVSE